MKKLLKPLVILGLSAGLIMGLVVGCTKKSQGQNETVIKIKQGQGEPLAQIGKVTLTLDEMRQDFLDRQGTFRGAAHLNTEKKRSEYIENQVMQEAMFQEAIALGYFDDPEVKRNVKKFVVQKYNRDKLAKAQEAYVPSEEEMRQYYEKNPLHFNREEALKVAYLAIPFGSDQKSARAAAQTLQKTAVDTVKEANMKEFARLAINFAQGKTASGSGKIETNESEYLEKDAFEAKFGKDSYKTVMALENIGTIGPVLSSDTSYFVVMKRGERKKHNESFEDAKPKIAKRIAFEKRAEVHEKLMAELRQKYQVKIFQERLAELSNDPNPPKAVAENAENPHEH